MTPSQQPRSTRGRTRTSATAFSAVVLLGASLALSACSGQEAGAAAIVDDATISDKDIQSVTLQLNPLAKDLTPSAVLLGLILAPYVQAEASRGGKGVTDAQVRKVIAKVPKPSPQTIDFVRTEMAIQSLDAAAKTSIVAKLGQAKITVNPRYGTFDLKQVAVLPTSPNWIKAAGTSQGAK